MEAKSKLEEEWAVVRRWIEALTLESRIAG